MRIKIVAFILIISSCKNYNDFYQGKVTDDKSNPIESVAVKELGSNIKVLTDSNGYFKLNRDADWLGKLVFSKEGYKTDTIPTVWSHAGESLNYNFITNDITVVVLRK